MNDLIDALATFRLTRLAVEDTITERAREQLHARLELAGHPKLAYLTTCPWCAGMYVAAGVVLARRVVPRVWAPLAAALAFSAVAGLLSDR